MEELWVDVKGYEGLYQVSNFGRVKRLCKHRPDKILVFTDNGWGYNHIGLTKNYKRKIFKVHRLVYDHFFGLQPNMDIDHIDGNKKNNRLENLRMVNRRENIHYYHQTQKRSSKYIGVCLFKKTGKWVAYIDFNKKRHHLGIFKTEIEAAEKYKHALHQVNTIGHLVN